MEQEDIDRRAATILDGAQDSVASHARCMNDLSKLCEVAGAERVLTKSLMSAVHQVLVVFKREPCVERIVTFLIQFTSQSLFVVQGLPFPVYFMTKLLPYTKASKGSRDTELTKAVRFRSTQLVAGVLNALSEETELKNAFWSQLESHLVERASDKVPLIRIQAVLGLSRLQDVEESANAASKTYLRLLATDPNKEVRRTVLNNLVMSRHTLPDILDRVRDSNADVRADALRLLASNVRLKTLSIKQRVFLLQSGLNDRDANVKKECMALCMEWLKSQGASIPVLLKAFDITNCEDRLIETLIEALLENVSIETIDWRKEVMSPELAMLWRVYVKWNREAKRELEVEANLPENLIEFCELITTVVTESASSVATGYILRQVLQLAPWLDKSDEGGRRAVLGLLCEVAAENFLAEADVESVMKAVYTFSFGMEDFVNRVKEALARSREHLELFEQEESAELVAKQEARIAELKRSLGPAELRKMLAKKREDEDEAATSGMPDTRATLRATAESDAEDEDEDVAAMKQELNMLWTLKTNRKRVSEWCWMRTMTLLQQLLAHATSRDLDPSASTVACDIIEFVPKYIAIAMSHASIAVRIGAMRAIGGVATLEAKRNAVQHVELLYHALSNDELDVRVEALKVLFDLALSAGFEVFSAHPEENFMPHDEDFCAPGIPHEYPEHSLFAVLYKYLEDEDETLQTTAVEGFTKLFATRKLACPRTLSTLLVLLFNPDTNDNVILQQSLALFMPMYAFASYQNQALFADAFLPTLRAFLYAEMDSPLANAHIPTYLKFMLHLTGAAQLNANHKKAMKPESAECLHNRHGIDVCREILVAPSSKHAKTLAKFFGYFDVDCNDGATIRRLEALLKRVHTVIKDKVAEKLLATVIDALKIPEEISTLDEHDANELDRDVMESSEAALETLNSAGKASAAVHANGSKTKKSAAKKSAVALPPKSSKKLFSAKSRRRALDDSDSDSDSFDSNSDSEDEVTKDMESSNSEMEDEDEIYDSSITAKAKKNTTASASKKTSANVAKSTQVRKALFAEEDDEMSDDDDGRMDASDTDKDEENARESQNLVKAIEEVVLDAPRRAAKKTSVTAKKASVKRTTSSKKLDYSSSSSSFSSDSETETIGDDDMDENDSSTLNRSVSAASVGKKSSATKRTSAAKKSTATTTKAAKATSSRTAKTTASAASKGSKTAERAKLMKEMAAMLD